MKSLELRVPPVAVALLIAAAMWGLSTLTSPITPAGAFYLTISAIMVVVGIWISLVAVASFRQAKTTVNPTKPDSSSTLVSTGIYRHSRNPMYLGFLLILGGWAVFLASPATMLGPAIFVIYMNRFQIVPEERMLTTRFGDEFVRYQKQVRRWC